VRFRRRELAEAPSREPRQSRVIVPTTRAGTLLETAIVNYPFAEASREAALTVPAIVACRNLIVGAAVQMGIYRYREAERLEPGPLLTQPDPDTTWAATLGGTLDDILFYGRAYWLVLAFDGAGSEQNPEGFPIRARWFPYGDVTPELESQDAGAYSRLKGYRVSGVTGLVPPRAMIRFDSSLPGVLAIGSRTIAGAVAIEQAARRFADVELPAGTLTNEGTELSPDEARDVLAEFELARQERVVAFLQDMTYERTQLSAHDLQLVEGRAYYDTECTRLFNVPVSMVGASPSGNASALLYSNLTSQLAVLVSNAVAPHLRTIEQTLSLPSVTPRGQSVAFDVQTFLRSDPTAAAEYAVSLYGADLISRDEARAFLGIPAASQIELTPGRV
jgi:phage portal protein BeeE